MKIELNARKRGRRRRMFSTDRLDRNKLVNHLLAENLSWWDDPESGSLEGFLGTIDYRDRAGAERAIT